ncbi:MAG: hypothetical protein ACREL3_00815 [Gemmatimonadales bacterium]
MVHIVCFRARRITDRIVSRRHLTWLEQMKRLVAYAATLKRPVKPGSDITFR